jgi:uncharacterized damage-inducible protein DinB
VGVLTRRAEFVSDIGRIFIDHSRDLIAHHYLPRIEGAVARLDDDQIWWRPNEASNSVGNLILHLAGNLRQWIVSGVGGQADVRRRQEEFDARGPMPRADALDRLRASVTDADAVLKALPADALGGTRMIQQLDVTVFDAIYHVVEHFSMHTGQIIYAAKIHAGDLGFYDVTGGKPRPTWK